MPNQKSTAQTNTQENSQAKQAKRVITFDELWDNYPHGSPCDEKLYPNQCSIRVGVALQRCGVSFATYKGKGYAHCAVPSHTKEVHAIRVEELADWLNKRYLAGWPAPTDITGKDWLEKAKGKKGVIFFKDYWRRMIKDASGKEHPESSPTGDHIDLWNGSRLTYPDLEHFAANALRFNRIRHINSFSLDFTGIQLSFSDLAESKKILFWELR